MSISSASTKLPPGPKGRPFVGSGLDLRKDPLGFLMRLSRDYGDIAHFKAGSKHIYQINHPDYIRDVLVNNYRKFEQTGLMKQAKAVLGKGLFLSEGEFHHRQRRLVQPAFGRPRIPTYDSIMTEEASAVGQRWQDGQQVDIAQEMTHLTLPVVTKTLFSTDVPADLGEIETALQTVIEYFNRFLAPSSNWLSKLPTGRNRRFHQALAFLDQVVFQIIKEARGRDRDRGDVLSMLLRAQDVEGDGTGMNDAQVRDEVMTLFAAGHETVATTLTWTWYALATNPDVERKLHEELDRVLGGRLPTTEDVAQLKYTDYLLAEVMRMFPPVWAMSRRAIEDCTIGAYVVPAGSIVGMSQYVMHRDPRFFEDPEVFEPMRWTPENKSKRLKFSYFPFGGGPRLCIGEPFAWREATLVLATLCQQWKPRLKPGFVLEFNPIMTLRPKNGIPMTLERRSSAVATTVAGT